MCNTSSAYHVQHVMLHATWYVGTAQLLSLTELKSHLFELYFVGWIIKPMKVGRKPEYLEKTPGDKLQKMPHTTAQRFKPQARLDPVQQHWWQARKADMLAVIPHVTPKMASWCLERLICAPPLLSVVFPWLPSKQCQCLSGWTQIIAGLGVWKVSLFLSPLLFPSGDQCCAALACPCSEFSSSLGALLLCQAADQMWYLLCLPVYLPIYSHWLQHARAVDSQKSL